MGAKKKKTKKKTAKSKEPKADDKGKKADGKALAGASQDQKGKIGSGSPTSDNRDGQPFEPDLTLEDFNLADPFLQSITRNFISLDQRVKRGYKF